jgi:hypothetical protein
MSTGAKIAIGCVALVVLSGIVVVGVVGFGFFWAKGKVETAAHEVLGDQKKIQELTDRANANAFTPPADGVLSETRLVQFLDVRKRLYDVYLRHKTEIDAMGQKKEADLGDLTKGFGLLNEARLAKAQGLADAAMSEQEYAYFVGAIYTSAVASSVHKETGGRSLSDVTEDAVRKSAEALRQVAERTPDPSLPPEAQKAMREAQEQARLQQEQLQKESERFLADSHKLDVPPENLALFQKYEADIKKYSMTGLEWLL